MAKSTASQSGSGPPTKRSKPSKTNHNGEDGVIVEQVIHANIQRAWKHYQTFVDGNDDDDDDEDDDEAEHASKDGASTLDEDAEGEDEEEVGGDINELSELMKVLSPNTISPLVTTIISSNDDDDDDDNATVADQKLFHSRQSLLPILLSMSYLHLASHAISELLFDPDQEEEDNNGNGENNGNSSSPDFFFEQSLYYWPTNPAAHSLLAKYYRMNSHSLTEDVCELYVKAAKYAKYWRRYALEFLQSTSEEEDGEVVDAKEWVELLVLNGALGMDYIGGDEDEEGDGDGGGGEEKQDEKYSCSEVEATASFLSALLLSILSKHDDALPHLQTFQLSHRIHPNVWKEAQTPTRAVGAQTTATTRDKCNGGTSANESLLFQPRIYHGASATSNDANHCPNGVLPPALYQRLSALFAPNAPYWDESDYNERGYYSYFIDLEAATKSSSSVKDHPKNVIEDVIVNHLLPLAEQSMQDENSDSESPPHIVGAEWWVHTRPLTANLGHQLHFDTDESLLGKEKKITHPIVSSVLYLTGGERDNGKNTDRAAPSAGSTIVFDQSPESKEVAPKAWISHAEDNAFMTFPGNLLHGVLPCAGTGAGGGGDSDKEEINRLTFMVGFWTRNVTDGMGDDRRLYGPCGPFPPATAEHSWVMDSQTGYHGTTKQKKKDDDGNGRQERQKDIKFDALPSASPAWERINATQSQTTAPSPVIPKELDHRFFVLNAPHCFSDSLLEKGDCFSDIED